MYLGVSRLLYILLLSSLNHKYPNLPRSEDAWISPSVVPKGTSSVCVPQVWEHLYPADLGHVRAELLQCVEPALVLLRWQH